MEPARQRPTKDDLQYSPSKPRTRETPPIIKAPPIKRSPAQNICVAMGVFFILVGLAGFVMPELMGAHLSPAHNMIHLVSGILSLWFGTGKSIIAAKNFSRVFGTLYLLLGLAGFVFGGGNADSLIRPIPNILEFGTSDHFIHIAIGAIFLVAAYFTLRRNSKVTYH
ncbi:hypothetical protein D3C87_86870 [compost metagenome]